MEGKVYYIGQYGTLVSANEAIGMMYLFFVRKKDGNSMFIFGYSISVGITFRRSAEATVSHTYLYLQVSFYASNNSNLSIGLICPILNKYPVSYLIFNFMFIFLLEKNFCMSIPLCHSTPCLVPNVPHLSIWRRSCAVQTALMSRHCIENISVLVAILWFAK